MNSKIGNENEAFEKNLGKTARANASYPTSTEIDADASKGETSPGYFGSKLV